jgi:hypothetical protein
MTKSNLAENDLLALLFNGTLPAAGFLGTLSTSGNVSLYVALHTANPDETGNQNTSEAAYTGYARVAVARTSAGWTVSGGQTVNTAIIQFPLCAGGTAICSYVSIGTQNATSGQAAAATSGQIIYYGQLNDNRTISDGIQPQFSQGDLIITED